VSLALLAAHDETSEFIDAFVLQVGLQKESQAKKKGPRLA